MRFAGKFVKHFREGMVDELEDERIGHVGVEVEFIPIAFVPMPGGTDAYIAVTQFDSAVGVAFHHNTIRCVQIEIGKDLIVDTEEDAFGTESRILCGQGFDQTIIAYGFDVHDGNDETGIF